MANRAKKPEPFRHTPRELAVLGRAHSAMMAHIQAGRHYDVVKLAWVDSDGRPASDTAEMRVG